MNKLIKARDDCNKHIQGEICLFTYLDFLDVKLLINFLLLDFDRVYFWIDNMFNSLDFY